jgi:hypothetical protein
MQIYRRRVKERSWLIRRRQFPTLDSRDSAQPEPVRDILPRRWNLIAGALFAGIRAALAFLNQSPGSW